VAWLNRRVIHEANANHRGGDVRHGGGHDNEHNGGRRPALHPLGQTNQNDAGYHEDGDNHVEVETLAVKAHEGEKTETQDQRDEGGPMLRRDHFRISSSSAFARHFLGGLDRCCSWVVDLE
jgi:hypothetical protein